MAYRPAVERFRSLGEDMIESHHGGLEVGASLEKSRRAGDPPSNNLPEVPWHRKLNLRQNKRQRMSNSGRPFSSPDCILTILPGKDSMIPAIVLCILQVSKDSHYSQRSGTAGKDNRDLRFELHKEDASKSAPVGLTPE